MDKKGSNDGTKVELIAHIVVIVMIILICIAVIYLTAIVFKQFHKGDPLYMAKSVYAFNVQSPMIL